MKTKTQNTVAFFLAILVIAAMVFVSGFGIKGLFGGVFTEGTITQGLDLAGGTRIVYSPENGYNPNNTELDSVENVLRTRLDALGYTEGTVTRTGDNMFIVEIPGESDTDSAVSSLGSTAQLEFRDAAGNVVLSGTDIVSAVSAYGDPSNTGASSYYISLSIAESSVSKFAEATAAAAAKSSTSENYIAIYLDEAEISRPFVHEQLNTSDVVITGSFSKAEADEMAALISSGKLAFSLQVEQTEVVTATLGGDALQKALIAGAIGIGLIIIFMLAYYRILGVASALALIIYIALMGFAINIFKVNLSLAGIAGVLLSIGMAVDANVVIFERIREELRNGKTTSSAVKAGFKNAFSAILDSNVTTVIASIVLIWFGTGSVKGFAISLLLGVIISFLTAVFITRFFVDRITGMGFTKAALYGVKVNEEVKSK